MRWPQVMSTPTTAAWDKATDLAQFLSEAALYICSSGEWSSDAKSAEDVETRDVALVARARLQVTFHEIAWALESLAMFSMPTNMLPTIQRWRALRRRACVPLFGAALGATPSLPRVHLSRSRWCTMCGGIQLKPQLCAASKFSRLTSL